MFCHRTDLRDLWRPGGGESRMTWRLLGNLIRHLPPESALKTALRNQMSDAEIKSTAAEADPSQGQWTHLEMLIASLVDAVRINTFTLRRLNGDKRAQPPDPVPRPGVKPKGQKRRRLTTEQTAAVLRRIRGESTPQTGTWRQSPPGKVTRLTRN
jgi:hypothetical protein